MIVRGPNVVFKVELVAVFKRGNDIQLGDVAANTKVTGVGSNVVASTTDIADM